LFGLRFGITEIPNGKTEKRKHANALKERHHAVPHHLEHGRAVLLWLVKHFDLHIVSFVN
jgi:uncharacterized protein YheU (UPF0270 family)